MRPPSLAPVSLLIGLIVAGGVLVATGLAGCGGSPSSGAHWPKSAGAITPDDPAEDGGESLEPHQAGEAAAIEHGGEDITAILDEPAVNAAAAPAPAATSTETPADTVPEAVPAFEEIIIVQ